MGLRASIPACVSNFLSWLAFPVQSVLLSSPVLPFRPDLLSCATAVPSLATCCLRARPTARHSPPAHPCRAPLARGQPSEYGYLRIIKKLHTYIRARKVETNTPLFPPLPLPPTSLLQPVELPAEGLAPGRLQRSVN